MIAIKYAKRYPLSMISQSDMLNVIKRILTRAGVKVEYSAGFNPHMLLYFSPALSLGIESECEYVCAAAGYAPDLIEKLNDAAPSGFECLKVFLCPVNPTLPRGLTPRIMCSKRADLESRNFLPLRETPILPSCSRTRTVKKSNPPAKKSICSKLSAMTPRKPCLPAATTICAPTEC